ncbi:hypothetical protein SLOPH_1218 [Spraguea lophii 42_110]|uniref:Nucleoporin NSP1-like C-terminal domain-containing protein n=1 Tax=Spraguea lophii (strain 42_110) TaxID=1358809 RepID=S7W8C7_SPRLO|nr:hypothetical protein SLOPH_1218 [Spraguea lophii 42_110]
MNSNNNSPFSFGQQNNTQNENKPNLFPQSTSSNIFNPQTQQTNTNNQPSQNQPFNLGGNQTQTNAFSTIPKVGESGNPFSTQPQTMDSQSNPTQTQNTPFQQFKAPPTMSTQQPGAQTYPNNIIIPPTPMVTKTEQELSAEIDTPIGFGQKVVNEIVEEIKENLEKDVKNYKKVAQEVFAANEKIIKARNNYSSTIKLIEKEESKLKELDETIDLFNEYFTTTRKELDLKDTSMIKKDQLLDCIFEIENLYGDFNSLVAEIKDEDDEIMAVINENMGIIKELDRDLKKLEVKK